MKIFIDQFCLANGGSEGPRDLLIQGEGQVQTVRRLRGTGDVVFARGNRLHTLSFTVVRQHAGYGAAEAFLWEHAAALPASGTLSLQCGGAGGGSGTGAEGGRYAASASAVVSEQGSQAGLVTTHRYKVVCGEIVRVEG